MYKNSELIIPSLQREYVWNCEQASLFIDSLLRGLPVPSLFFTEKNSKYLIIDGTAEDSVEKQFAEDLETASEVCGYAKLPCSFQIPTPVGDYAPDWAIAFNDNCGIKHIYFVAETKGSMEIMELRSIEERKTKCVRQLFNNFRIAGKARYEVVNSYSQQLDVMKAIEL